MVGHKNGEPVIINITAWQKVAALIVSLLLILSTVFAAQFSPLKKDVTYVAEKINSHCQDADRHPSRLYLEEKFTNLHSENQAMKDQMIEIKSMLRELGTRTAMRRVTPNGAVN